MNAQLKPNGNQDDVEYDRYIRSIQENFLVDVKKGPLFTTNVNPETLWHEYLNSFAEPQRQYHNCHACRRFIQTYGGLVYIDADGRKNSPIWNVLAPERYQTAANALSRLVARSAVTGVFHSSEKVWGLPVTGLWKHFAVVPPKDMVWKHPIQTTFQAMAEKKQDHETVINALVAFPIAIVDQALALLEADAVYRAEKVIGPARWLHKLQEIRRDHKGDTLKHLLWREIAMAPAGFCHPRSSMIGTLLEDLQAGLPFDDVKRRFDAKMQPGVYGRSVAPVKSGQILAAERLVEGLQAQGSLARRYARLDDLRLLWPTVVVKPSWPASALNEQMIGRGKRGGVFASLQEERKQGQIQIDGKAISMTKFIADILPRANSIKILAPQRGHYGALTTAVNADAPPILQWDKPDLSVMVYGGKAEMEAAADHLDTLAAKRNPVAWFRLVGGSEASSWGLQPGWQDVYGICLQPSMWQEGFDHHGKGAFFLIAGAKPTKDYGTFLFPELLRSELRPIRAVIDQFSAKETLQGKDTDAACGLKLTAGEQPGVVVSVASNGIVQNFAIDRWE